MVVVMAVVVVVVVMFELISQNDTKMKTPICFELHHEWSLHVFLSPDLNVAYSKSKGLNPPNKKVFEICWLGRVQSFGEIYASG